MDEIKDIAGYEGYQITRSGKIFNKITGLEIKAHLGNHHYLYTGLCKNGKAKKFLLHRLVAQTFLENPHNFDFVDHIDHNRQNNNLENLRWVSRTMNNNNMSISKNNKCGEQHICHMTDKRREYHYWKVQFNSKHIKRIQKFFPFTEQGFEQAKAFRDQMKLKIFEEVMRVEINLKELPQESD